jgi:deuterolysin
MTHATSGTIDVIYGCSGDQSLSASQQIVNADSYNVSRVCLRIENEFN